MIKTFKNKGLKELFSTGSSKHLPASQLNKIRIILAMIHSATVINDCDLPGKRLHRLKKPPYQGFWSLDVTGNYRIIFEFENGQAYNIDFLDTH